MSESTIYQLKTMAVLTALAFFFTMLGWGIAGRPGLLIAAAISIAGCTGICLMADRLVLRMHGARRIYERHAPGLFRIVRELSRRADLPVPRMYLMADQGANAFATGLDADRKAIAVSTGLLGLLDGEELAAVIAHEFGHLRRGDTLLMTVLAAITGALIFLSNLFAWSRLIGSGSRKARFHDGIRSDAFFWALISRPVATVIRSLIPDSSDYRADEYGARLIGDASPLVRAINKIDSEQSRVPLLSASPATAHLFICNPLSSRQPSQSFLTHPPIGERLERLEALGLWRPRRRLA
jgi:heat shock protein HtpX